MHSPPASACFLALGALLLLLSGPARTQTAFSSPAGAAVLADLPPGVAYRSDRVLVAYHPQAAPRTRLTAAARVGAAVDLRGGSPYFTALTLSPAARAAG